MLKVSNVSSKETGGSSEEANGDACRLGGDSLVTSDDTIILQPLDTLQVSAGTLLRVQDGGAIDLVLALSSGQVGGGAKAVDIVGLVVVLVAISIVVVVLGILVGSILISCQTGHAVGGNDGVRSVRGDRSSVVLLVVDRLSIRGDLAIFIIEETKGDNTSLSAALRSKPVLVAVLAAIFVLGALDGRVHIEHTIVVVSISIAAGAEGSVDAVSLVAVVVTQGLVALVTLGVASFTVGLTSLLGHLLFICEVCF